MRVSSSSAQWQTAHAVAGHSGQFCDMAPLSGTRRAAEPILPHARSPVTPGTFATRFRWSRSVAHRAPQSLFTARTDARHSGDVCDQVPMARSRSSNHGAELTYGDEKFFDYFAIVSELFVKIRFLCGKSDFFGLSVWFFVSRGWHLWYWFIFLLFTSKSQPVSTINP